MTQSPSPIVDEAGIEAFREWYINHTGKMITRSNARKAVGTYLAFLVSPPKAGAGEPVAWRVVRLDGYLLHLCESRAAAQAIQSDYPTNSRIEPLFAKHEARRDGVRVTDEMVERAADALYGTAGIAGRVLTTSKEQARATAKLALEAALPPLGDDVTPEAVDQLRQKAAPIIGAEQWEPLGDGSAEIVEGAAETLAFNALHLIAEDDKDDALRTLEIARDVMRETAEKLRSIPPPKSSEPPGNAGVST